MVHLKYIFCFLAVIKTCYCDKVVESLPVPDAKYLSISDPATLTVRWDPIEVKDNPILGVKVKLWEDEMRNITKFVMKDGKYEPITELVPVKKSILTLPTHEPKFIQIVPANETSATFDIKVGVHYEIRVQSYNEQGDGPLSSASGVRIHPD